jgi:sugar lactone lactonase YvrE
MDSVEILVDEHALNGEGPVWDARAQELYWVDIVKAAIFIYNPASGLNRKIDLSGRFSSIGTLVLREQGGLIFAPDRSIAALDLETLSVQILAEPEKHLPGNRFNDGKCDPLGRFLVGSMAIQPDGRPGGSLYSLDTDLSLKKLRDGLVISNGMGWSPDGRRFYLADSFSRDIWVYDYDLQRGEIANERVAFRLPEGMGVADGLTVDQEGLLWLAVWDGACILRCDPYSGKLVQRLDFPARRTSCCVFGGQDLDELYVTSAAIGLQDEDWQEFPHNGALMRKKMPVKGLPSYTFQG